MAFTSSLGLEVCGVYGVYRVHWALRLEGCGVYSVCSVFGCDVSVRPATFVHAVHVNRCQMSH